MPFSIDLINDAAAFERLKTDWNELVEAMAFPEIFYRFEWNDAFRRHFRADDRLFVLLLREDGQQLAAIAPFAVRRTRRLGIEIKVLETIVGGVSDYSNILIREGVHRGRAVEAILDFLREHAGEWDVIDFCDFCSRDSTTLHLLNLAPAYPDWSVRTHVSTPVAWRDLRRPPQAANEKRLHRVRNRAKALRQKGLELQVGIKGEDIERYWPMFCDLHRKAWPGEAFREPRSRAFYDELKSVLAAEGKVELSVAMLDGRLAAAHFGFVDSRKVFYYMPAMDDDFRNERVGSILLEAMVEQYGAKLEVFDFQRGVQPYKLWYTDELDLNLRLVIYRSAGLRALLYNFAGVTKRYGVELGFPKAIAQAIRSWRRC